MVANNYTQNNISAIEIGGIRYNLKSIPFHATEAEWLEINYTPKQAEIIVYDTDTNYNYLRFKIGDGVTQASLLPFSLASMAEIQAYVNNQINSAGHLKRIVLDSSESLPSESDAQTDAIYMKPFGGGLTADVYEEYMLINGKWEIIGNTRVDLSDYATIEYVEKQGFLKGETYRGTVTSVGAGTGLKITGDASVAPTVQIDTDVVFVLDCGTSTINID